MDGTIITQGSFVSTGNAKYIPLRSSVDWMRVYNWTNSIGTTALAGLEFYWQRGMPAGRGIVYNHLGADHSVNINQITAGQGFTLYDTSIINPGAQIAVTATSNAAAPVITCNATGLTAFSSLVRIEGVVAAPSICGIDFSPAVVAGGLNNFTLPTLGNAIAAGGAGFYRVIPYNPMFYPRNRTICNISQAANAVVTTTVPHNLTVGQQVRFQVPQYPALAGRTTGMREIDGLLGTVLTVDAPNNLSFTVDIDTTGFTAFAWPLAADVPCQYSQMIPVGVAAAHPYENVLSDATLNTGEIGMILGAGTDAATRLLAPAGTANDVIYWVAGKSWNM